jgi:hypothetical protein
MSRSRRKTPIRGVAGASSERFEKRQTNRRLRGAVKEAVRRGIDPLPIAYEIGDRWDCGKDGMQSCFGHDRRAPRIREALAK